MNLKYIAIYEQTPNNYSAYLPDLPGCVAAAETWNEIQKLTQEAVALHLAGMLEDGDPLPPTTMSPSEAMAHHAQPLSESDLAQYAQHGEAPPLLSTTFAPVKVAVDLESPAIAGIESPALPSS